MIKGHSVTMCRGMRHKVLRNFCFDRIYNIFIYSYMYFISNSVYAVMLSVLAPEVIKLFSC